MSDKIVHLGRKELVHQLMANINLSMLLNETDSEAHALSSYLSMLFIAADKDEHVMLELADLNEVVNEFKKNGLLQDVSVADLSSFVEMVYRQFQVTSDIGVPILDPLSNIATKVQEGSLDKVEGQKTIDTITKTVRTRINQLEITPEMRAMLINWLENNIYHIPPLDLSPQALKLELDKLAQAFADKVLSGQYYQEQKQSKATEEYLNQFKIEERIKLPVNNIEALYFTFFYEMMKIAITNNEQASMRDAVKLVKKFTDSDLVDTSEPGEKSGWIDIAKEAYWRGRLVHEAGFAMPPFRGIEKQVVMGIMNNSSKPLNLVTGKIKQMHMSIPENSELDDEMKSKMVLWCQQCLNFARQSVVRLSTPQTFLQGVFQYIQTISQRTDKRSEITKSVTEYFGGLLLHHYDFLTQTASTVGVSLPSGIITPEHSSDLCYDIYQKILSRNAH